MTIDAKITMKFERGALTEGYYLHTTVHPLPATDPIELVKCLLIRTASSTQPEQIARVCTVPEVLNVTDLEPPLIQLHTGIAVSWNNIQAGESIIFDTIPDLWIKMGYVVPPLSFPIGGIDPVHTRLFLMLPSHFPAYLEDLSFRIPANPGFHGVLTATDGVAGRYIDPAFPVPYFRTQEYWAPFDDMPTAFNKWQSLRAEAQSLVTSYEAYDNTFEGATTEVFD